MNTLMKSSQPSRVEVQAMLQDEELSDKFNKDPRRFSRNYETSLFLNEFGLGEKLTLMTVLNIYK